MKNRRIALYASIIVAVLIMVATSVINTHRFDMRFNVDSAQPEIMVDKVQLTGLIIKFPLDLYFIKGNFTMGETDYKLANYYKSGFNPIAKVGLYDLKLVNGKNEAFMDGIIRCNGDIIQGNLIDITITLNFMDKTTGNSYSQSLNASHIQD